MHLYNSLIFTLKQCILKCSIRLYYVQCTQYKIITARITVIKDIIWLGNQNVGW